MNITYHNVVICVVADSKYVVGAVDFINNIAESSGSRRACFTEID